MSENQKRGSYSHDGYVNSLEEIESFLDDIEAVCRAHGLCIGHQDTHGGFEICAMDESVLSWMREASDARGG